MKVNQLAVALDKKMQNGLNEQLRIVSTLGDEFKVYYKTVWYNPACGEMYYSVDDASQLGQKDGDFVALAEVAPERPRREDLFDEHSMFILALAGAMSKGRRARF